MSNASNSICWLRIPARRTRIVLTQPASNLPSNPCVPARDWFAAQGTRTSSAGFPVQACAQPMLLTAFPISQSHDFAIGRHATRRRVSITKSTRAFDHSAPWLGTNAIRPNNCTSRTPSPRSNNAPPPWHLHPFCSKSASGDVIRFGLVLCPNDRRDRRSARQQSHVPKRPNAIDSAAVAIAGHQNAHPSSGTRCTMDQTPHQDRVGGTPLARTRQNADQKSQRQAGCQKRSPDQSASLLRPDTLAISDANDKPRHTSTVCS